MINFNINFSTFIKGLFLRTIPFAIVCLTTILPVGRVLAADYVVSNASNAGANVPGTFSYAISRATSSQSISVQVPPRAGLNFFEMTLGANSVLNIATRNVTVDAGPSKFFILNSARTPGNNNGYLFQNTTTGTVYGGYSIFMGQEALINGNNLENYVTNIQSSNLGTNSSYIISGGVTNVYNGLASSVTQNMLRNSLSVNVQSKTIFGLGGALSALDITLLRGSYNQNTLNVITSSQGNNLDNYAYGGGIYAGNIATVDTASTISNNSVTASSSDGSAKNVGGYGGGLFAYANINDLGGVIANNRVIVSGGETTHGFGGGVFSRGNINSVLQDINLNEITITNGSADKSISSYAGGGGLASHSVGRLTGHINDNKITVNGEQLASAYGGGLYSSYETSDSIKNTRISFGLRGNKLEANSPSGRAEAYGGGLAFGGSASVVNDASIIVDGGFFNSNTVLATGSNASAGGGAIYYDKDTVSNFYLKPSTNDIIFSDNTVTINGTSKNNDFFIGGRGDKNSTLHINGNSSATNDYNIYLTGGIDSGISGGKVTINRSILSGERSNKLVWGGTNRFTDRSGTSAFEINLNSGTTYLNKDFKFVSDPNAGSITLVLGKGHRLGIDFNGRDRRVAAFDLTNAKNATFLAEKGTKIIAPDNGEPVIGSYLLVDGINGFKDLRNISVERTDNFLSGLKIRKNQLWLGIIATPNNQPIRFHANSERAFDSDAFWDWFSDENGGDGLTQEQLLAIINNLYSITPEHILTSGINARKIHRKVADVAIEKFERRKNTKATKEKLDFSNVSIAYSAGQIRDYHLDGSNSYWAIQEKPSNLVLANVLKGSSSNVSNFNKFLYGSDDDDTNAYGIKIWSGYIGDFSYTRGFKDYSGYNSDTNGIVVGLSYFLNEKLSFGVYNAYTNSHINFREMNAKGNTDAYHAGLIARYNMLVSTNFVLDGAYSHYANHLERNPGGVGASKANFDHNIYSVGFKAEHKILSWKKGEVAPFASVRYVKLEQESVDERGGAMPSYVGRVNSDSVYTKVGLSASHEFDLSEDVSTKVYSSAAWEKLLNRDYLKANSYYNLAEPSESRYSVHSAHEDREAVVLGFGLDTTFKTSDSTALGLNFSYNFTSKTHGNEHGVYGGLEFSF